MPCSLCGSRLRLHSCCVSCCVSCCLISPRRVSCRVVSLCVVLSSLVSSRFLSFPLLSPPLTTLPKCRVHSVWLCSRVVCRVVSSRLVACRVVSLCVVLSSPVSSRFLSFPLLSSPLTTLPSSHSFTHALMAGTTGPSKNKGSQVPLKKRMQMVFCFEPAVYGPRKSAAYEPRNQPVMDPGSVSEFSRTQAPNHSEN